MTDPIDGDNAFLRTDLRGSTDEAAYAGALSFMRRKYSRDLAEIDLAVTGIPADLATTNRPGARFGPRAIRAASSMMAWERPYGMPFDPFERLAVVDYGDCVLDFARPDTIAGAIRDHTRGIIDQGAGVMSLGGDHFVTLPLLEAHAEKHGRPLSLLHFDAHTDTWDDDAGRMDHGTMLYHAVQAGLVDPTSSVQIGIRTRNEHTLGFHILDAPFVHERGIATVIAEARRVLGDRPVYVTFDIDCLDPAFAPGTGTPVCGGLSTHQASAILRGMAGIDAIGMDLTEVAPAYDSGEVTALAGAHLTMELIGLYAARPR